MGVLIDVESETFLLPKEHFTAATRALAALATESPSSFAEPRAVASAEDLHEAFAAAMWSFENNDAGDLVALSYGDKGPDDYEWPRSVLEALAPFVTSGTIVYRIDGDDRETVYTFAKGKLRARTRKQKKAKAASPAPSTVAHEPWIVAPKNGFGIEWRVRLPAEPPWFRKRDRVTFFFEALAKTKVWRELEEVHYGEKLLPIAPKDGVLPVADVVKRVADGQWGIRWLARRDREATLEVGLGPLEMGFRLRVRDGALARIGSAVIDEVAAALASYARANRTHAPTVGHAAPFGPGYVLPADASQSVLRGPDALVSGHVHFRAHALASIFDGLPREKHEQEDDAAKRTSALPAAPKTPAAQMFAKILAGLPRREPQGDRAQANDTASTIRALAAEKTPPAGATRSEADGVVVVTFPCDVTNCESLRAAAAAHAKWIATNADVAAIPSSFPPPSEPTPRARRADDPALDGYMLEARFELRIDDEPYWFRDRAFFEVVYRAFAKTAYWSELAKPGPAAVDAAIAAVVTGRNDKSAVLKRGDALKLELSPNVHSLEIVLTATRPVLTKLGARATRDLVAFLADVHGTLAGRGRLRQAFITGAIPQWNQWHQFVGEHEQHVERWPAQDACIDIFDPLAIEDGESGRALHITRTLTAAPLPPGAERVEAGRLVAILFTDDLSDPIATAEATARRAAWIRSVQAAAGLTLP